MISPISEIQHVVFLYSDSGGGQCSAAEAIVDALNLEYPDQVQMSKADVFNTLAHPQLHCLLMVRLPQAWKLGCLLSKGRRRSGALINRLRSSLHKTLSRFMVLSSCDIIVFVYPMSNGSTIHSGMIKRLLHHVPVTCPDSARQIAHNLMDKAHLVVH